MSNTPIPVWLWRDISGRRVEEFIDEQNMAPRVILMENHGMIACGRTPRDVETITSMYVKTARTLIGIYAMGKPRFLTPENVSPDPYAA